MTRPGNAIQGVLWMLLAAALFTAMSALAKTLGQRLDSMQIAFFRAFFALVFVTPFALSIGWKGLASNRPWLHVWRGLFGSSAMLAGFYAFVHLPLALSTAINFTTPLFLIVLAALFLGERVRLRRGLATLVGFAGVLVILRPDTGLDQASLIGLAGAFLAACSFTLIKTMAKNDRPSTMVFYFGVFASAFSAIPAWIVWIDPTPLEWVLLAATGAAGGAAQACTARAYALAEATFVAPFDYTRLLYSGLVGYILFQEVPDGWSYAGIALIVGSTLYIARREAHLAAETGKPPVADRPADRSVG
ncbi:DMT family transporter [Zavarzinia sp. CC-PAN008]|uniref:DMT family transporter n=1 Tax=Zavarzinia sp. CC-PAN008 TaxID=3243332 RepID=UPI003F744972